jgi:hypothetical protein
VNGGLGATAWYARTQMLHCFQDYIVITLKKDIALFSYIVIVLEDTWHCFQDYIIILEKMVEKRYGIVFLHCSYAALSLVSLKKKIIYFFKRDY